MDVIHVCTCDISLFTKGRLCPVSACRQPARTGQKRAILES